MDDYNQDEYWDDVGGVVDGSSEAAWDLWQWLFQEFG